MSEQFFIEDEFGVKQNVEDYFMTDYFLLDQYIGDRLWLWGNGGNGRLGTNATTDRSTPVTTFAGGINWKMVSAGGGWSSAIKTDGTLWIWGIGNSGQLAVNDNTRRDTPITTILGGTDWKYLTSTTGCTSAIKTDGSLWIWGTDGIMHGTNSNIVRSTPTTTILGANDWRQISSGTIACIGGIKIDGSLWMWGNNLNGQLGVGDTVIRSTPVTTILGGNNWKQVSVGEYHTVAIKTDGSLWSWGSGLSGQCGTNDNISRSTPVTTFFSGNNWKSVTTVASGTFAIKNNGTLWVCGVNTTGTLGVNDLVARSTPITTILGGNDWKQIGSNSSNDTNVSAIKTDGSLWVWGLNFNGQLGVNDGVTRSTPITTIIGGTNWKMCCSGVTHTLAIQHGQQVDLS